MKDLTREILQEEGEKFFPRLNANFDLGYPETEVKTTVTVFPEYKRRRRNEARDTLYDGHKSTGWVMQDYISHAFGLAYHMIDNSYPTTEILTVLPKGFSEKVAKRLGK